MRYLMQGNMSERRFNALISLASIRSEKMITALEDYLCNNRPQSFAYNVNNVDKSNFKSALKRLNSIEECIELIKEEDWDKFKSGN